VSLPDISDIDSRVGAAIRAERLRAGIKQEELAAAIGLDRTTLSRYEAGSRSVPIGALLQIAYVLRAPLSELIPGARAMETAWADSTEHEKPPAVQEITKALSAHPNWIAQTSELLALLAEREQLMPNS
jgi:transcriptional regulator with XRE-family HTH domain